MALNKILYPVLAKELKSKLLQESIDFSLMVRNVLIVYA